MSKTDKAVKISLLCFSLYCGVRYRLFETENHVDATATKVWGTATLALYHHLNKGDAAVTRSLIAHTLGDALIELPGPSILYAIPAFLVGHLAYAEHLRNKLKPLNEASGIQFLIANLMVVTCSVITRYFMDHTDGIIHAVLPFYTLALSSTFVFSALQKENARNLMLASAAYIISDLLIGLRELKIPNALFNTLSQCQLANTPLDQLLSWFGYYFSQYYIATRAPEIERSLVVATAIDDSNNAHLRWVPTSIWKRINNPKTRQDAENGSDAAEFLTSP